MRREAVSVTQKCQVEQQVRYRSCRKLSSNILDHESGGYTKQIFNVEENLQFRGEKMLPKTFIAREKPAPGFEASEDGLTLMQLVTLS